MAGVDVIVTGRRCGLTDWGIGWLGAGADANPRSDHFFCYQAGGGLHYLGAHLSLDGRRADDLYRTLPGSDYGYGLVQMNELNHWWPLLGIAVMRPLGIVLLLPLFGSAALGGALIRNALVLITAFPVLPLLTPLVLPNPLQDPVHYALLLATEFGVGILLSFSAAIPFWAIDIAGYVIDTMRGASMSSIFNPLLGSQSSPMGAFFAQLLTVLFMVLGGYHVLLGTLYNSYQLLPPGQDWYWGNGVVRVLQQQWHQLYTLGLSFAMPAIVMMVLIDLALGLINRSAQQLNVFSLSMPIKSVMVLLMLIIAMQFGFSGVLKRIGNFDNSLLLQLIPKS